MNIESTLSKEEIISIVYHLLSQMQEGITDFKFYEIVRQTNDFLLITVGYTWSLNGHKKPVDKKKSFFLQRRWRLAYISVKPSNPQRIPSIQKFGWDSCTSRNLLYLLSALRGVHLYLFSFANCDHATL